jgi:hypothetical protein
MTGTIEDPHADFAADFDRAIRKASDQAACAMLARGRYIVYCEEDTPEGHVIREYPDGTVQIVKVDLAEALRQSK